MIPYLRQHPFLLISIFFIAGILTSGFFIFPFTHLLCFATICLLIAIFSEKWLPIRWKGVIPSVFIFLSFYLFGVSRYHQQARASQTHHFSNFQKESLNEVTGEVLEVNRGKLLLKVDRLNEYPVTGMLTVFSTFDFTAGDRIFARLHIQEIQPPKNPFQFDFQKYYHHKQIWHQANFSEEPLVLGKNSGFIIWMKHLRALSKQKLREILPGENEFALANALILGDKRELGTELRNAYADTGAIHVLAVSGLHVGVVYMILLFFIRGILPVFRGWRVVRSLLVLTGLWFFVYLVGAPISAWRAAFMFSLFEIGVLVSKNSYPVNTLSLAAFVLLMIDANSFFDVGFQLSFLAVLGIVTCQRPIQGLWVVENPVGFKIWQLITLSLAAQVFTFPLTIYYFHQFPVYFWLSGLLAVPFAYAVLTLGLLTLLFQWVPGLEYILGQLLLVSTYALNSWIFIVQALPGLLAEHLWLNLSELVALLLISLSLALFINSGKQIHLQYLLTSLIIFLVFINVERWKKLHQLLLVAYHDRHQQYIDLLVGNKAFPLHPPHLEIDLPEDIKASRKALGIRVTQLNPSSGEFFRDGGFAVVSGQRIYVQDSLFNGLSGLPELDYIFLDAMPSFPVPEHLSRSAQWIVNNRKRQKYQSLETMDLKFHDIQRDGTIILNLKNR